MDILISYQLEMLKEMLLKCAGEPGCASKTTVYYIVYIMQTPFRDDLKCGPAFWRHDYFSCPDCHVPIGLETHLQNDDGQHGSCCAVENGGFCPKPKPKASRLHALHLEIDCRNGDEVGPKPLKA